MAIPDYQPFMLPLLRFYASGHVSSPYEATELLVQELKLTPEDRLEMLPSGKGTKLRNRIGWAKWSLTKAGLLITVERGKFRITAEGERVLASNPPKIDVRFLKQFPSYAEFLAPASKTEDASAASAIIEAKESPEELIASAHSQLKRALASDLLARIKLVTPVFFEHLVVELLVKMGYGGWREGAGNVLGRSGDGGIDGIINEDRLGLDSIYLQAKRWENPVGRPEIQKFAGALFEQRAKKGVFITTSTFSKEALLSAEKHDARIVLIDGEKLATLMIDHGLGVTLEATYEVKRIDSDYFADE